jgi:predicted  nucleic acid-binding Zn-ribbon protein
MLTEIRDKNYQNFSIDYSKHKNILSEIWESIDKSKKLLADFNTSKEDLEKLEIKKQEINKEILLKKNELVILNDNIKDKSQELDLKLEQNKQILLKIEEEKRLIREELEWMRQFEKDLQLMEKRLNNFKISLKKQWEHQQLRD